MLLLLLLVTIWRPVKLRWYICKTQGLKCGKSRQQSKGVWNPDCICDRVEEASYDEPQHKQGNNL